MRAWTAYAVAVLTSLAIIYPPRAWGQVRVDGYASLVSLDGGAAQITQFSYRMPRRNPLDAERLYDPLDPARLALRFSLFEIITLPSLLGQTDQDFTWVLLIDPALDARYRHEQDRRQVQHWRGW